MEHLGTVIATIGAAGIVAQWLSWRFGLPSIVLLSVAGLLVGPFLGIVEPKEDFGELLKPLIAAAVAIILFEGGLTLHFKEIRETSKAVRRIVLIGGPVAWLLGALAAHYVGGLSWQTSVVMAGLFVVTGPTVIMPLLRQAQLTQRPASVIRWEAIINDPIGALYAVLAFEVVAILQGQQLAGEVLARFALGMIVGVVGGYILGRLISAAYIRGYVPEFLKAAVLVAVILAAHSATNLILDEVGLITVTVMGITLANSKIASLGDLRRFKETLTVLLVSGLFVVLTAGLDETALAVIDWRIIGFLAAMLFIVRPASVFLASIGTTLTFRERLLVGWIAPRGIVAVAVSGLFGAALTDLGIEDGALMVPITFAIVFATVVLHGFTIRILARRLGLVSADEPGVLIVGASRFTEALAEKLTELEIPVMIADRNYNRLRRARLSKIPTFYGEILSEAAEFAVDRNRFGYLLAATENDDYNALVCTSFAPEFGHDRILQIGRLTEDESQEKALNFTIGGRTFIDPALDFWKLESRIAEGWTIQSTKLSDEYDYAAYMAERGKDADVIFVIRSDGRLTFATPNNPPSPEAGETLVALVKREPKHEAKRAQAAA